MRFCYLLRYAPTQTETFVYREAQGLIDAGHRVRAVSWEAREPGDELPDWELRHPPGRAALLPQVLRARGCWLAGHQRPKRVMQGLWFADQLDPDEVVHAHFAGEAAEWAREAWLQRGIPYSLTVHAVDLFKPRPSLGALVQDARVLLTVTHHNAELLQRRFGVQAQVIRCGAPELPLSPLEGPVLSVARDVPKKGLDLLRRACATLGEPLRLVGAEGPRPSSEVRAALASSRLFALPCREAPDGDRDGLPVALMEAMAAGLPVITTTLPGLEELVDESVGWLVPPDDEQALVQALREALADPEEARARGLRGRARVKRDFSVRTQVQHFLAAWS